MTMRVVYVSGDDWCGLYADSNLIMEGHSLSIRNIFEWLRDRGQIVESYETVEADLDWLGDRGDLPDALAEVVTI